MAECDTRTSEVIGIPSLVLMERAALSVADGADDYLKKTGEGRGSSLQLQAGEITAQMHWLPEGSFSTGDMMYDFADCPERFLRTALLLYRNGSWHPTELRFRPLQTLYCRVCGCLLRQIVFISVPISLIPVSLLFQQGPQRCRTLSWTDCSGQDSHGTCPGKQRILSILSIVSVSTWDPMSSRWTFPPESPRIPGK